MLISTEFNEDGKKSTIIELFKEDDEDDMQGAVACAEMCNSDNIKIILDEDFEYDIDADVIGATIGYRVGKVNEKLIELVI